MGWDRELSFEGCGTTQMGHSLGRARARCRPERGVSVLVVRWGVITGVVVWLLLL